MTETTSAAGLRGLEQRKEHGTWGEAFLSRRNHQISDNSSWFNRLGVGSSQNLLFKAIFRTRGQISPLFKCLTAHVYRQTRWNCSKSSANWTETKEQRRPALARFPGFTFILSFSGSKFLQIRSVSIPKWLKLDWWTWRHAHEYYFMKEWVILSAWETFKDVTIKTESQE